MSVIDKIKQKFSKRIRLHESYTSIFSTPAGQEVLSHILKEGFMFRTTFVVGDPHQTCLNEGSRRLALSILKHVNKNHDKLVAQVEKEIQQYEDTQ